MSSECHGKTVQHNSSGCYRCNFGTQNYSPGCSRCNYATQNHSSGCSRCNYATLNHFSCCSRCYYATLNHSYGCSRCNYATLNHSSVFYFSKIQARDGPSFRPASNTVPICILSLAAIHTPLPPT